MPRLLLATILIAPLTLGLAAQPERPKPQPTSPIDFAPTKSRDILVPPGIYTSIVLANPGGAAATVTLKAPTGEAVFVVPGNDTLIVPVGGGGGGGVWQLGTQATLTSTQSTLIASGITTSGPIRFAPPEKK